MNEREAGAECSSPACSDRCGGGSTPGAKSRPYRDPTSGAVPDSVRELRAEGALVDTPCGYPS